MTRAVEAATLRSQKVLRLRDATRSSRSTIGRNVMIRQNVETLNTLKRGDDKMENVRLTLQAPYPTLQKLSFAFQMVLDKTYIQAL